MFPPHCGGAGWSTYYLARALRARGHVIAVVRPRFQPDVPRSVVTRTTYDGFPIAEAVVPLPAHPLRRILARNWIVPRALRRLVAAEALRLDAALIHAQHALTVPAAVAAAAALAHRGRPPVVVATVRDYWPLCYYSTMQAEGLVPVQGPGMVPLARALWRAQGRRAVRWLPLLPFWEAATARRRAALRRADRVIAVSQFVAARLRRGRAVRPGRLRVIPNLVDRPQVAAILADPPPWDALGLAPGAPFLLFVGKLEPSKGVHLLPAMLTAAGAATLPLVVAGSGPLQPWLAHEAARRGLDVRFTDWLDNADVVRLMHATTLLLFPSAWDEPLSRVLLEACAAGAAILALNTGGTPDILADGQNGRLVETPAAFAGALRGLLADPAARARLAAGARATAAMRFSAEIVGAAVEALYQEVVEAASRVG